MKSKNLPDRESDRTTSAADEHIKNPTALGVAILRRRQGLNLTQADAAALCKVGTRFLSELENGKASLHFGKVIQVLRAFGMLMILRRKA